MLLSRLKNNGNVELWLNKLQLRTKKQIEGKIRAGIYMFERLTKCPICNYTDFELIGERDRYGLFYPVNICSNCGLVFVNPRMDQNSFNEFYRTEYRKLYIGSEKPTDQFFQQQYEQGRKIYNFLHGNNLISPTTGSVLEVGCGAGGILQFFKEKGLNVKGIDLGEDYLNFGKEKYSLDLHSVSLKNYQITEKPDIIIYSHVLEHILNLEEELALIRSISHAKTKVYIEVPSLKQMHRGYDLNILKYFHIAHTYHFTLTSLTNLLEKNGFSLVEGNEYVMSVFELRSTEQKEIVNDYEPAISYIKKYEKLRWAYFVTPRAIKYYLGMVVIKTLDAIGIKDKVKALLKK